LLTILEVCQSSLPTLSIDDRCIRNSLWIVRLVISSCIAYDDIQSGLSIMWSLIETTPSVLDNELDLNAQLDNIQSSLSACEILKEYIDIPKLSILLNKSCANKHENRNYKQELLNGCGFLVFDLIDNGFHSLENQSFQNGKDKIKQKIINNSGKLIKGVTSVETLVNFVSLGQVIILRILFNFGQNNANNNGKLNGNFNKNSNLTSNKWTKLIENVKLLCKTYFTDVTNDWIGLIFIKIILYYGLDSQCITALSLILDGETLQYSSNGPVNDQLYQLFLSLDIKSSSIENMILQKSRECFNSESNCSGDGILEAKELLDLLPSNSNDVKFEYSLHGIIELILSIGVDFVPVQIRLLDTVEIMKKILDDQPQRCYNFDNDEISNSNQRDEKSDIRVKMRKLKDSPICGLFMLKSFNSSNNPDIQANLLILLVRALIRLDDLEFAYRDCLALIEELNKVSCDKLITEIIDCIELVIGLLDNSDNIDSKLSYQLQKDLSISLVCNCSEKYIDRCGPLWKGLDKNKINTTYLNNMKSDISSINIEENNTIENIDDKDIAYIESATKLIWGIFTNLFKPVLIHNSNNPMKNIASDMIETVSIPLQINEVFGILILINNQDLVRNLLENNMNELENKRNINSKLFNNNGINNINIDNVILDENLVTLMIGKGFSRNAAKRSVLSTNCISLEAALIWAIGHCDDFDFEHPIVQKVTGALLSTKSLNIIQSKDINKAIKINNQLVELYDIYCNSKLFEINKSNIKSELLLPIEKNELNSSNKELIKEEIIIGIVKSEDDILNNEVNTNISIKQTTLNSPIKIVPLNEVQDNDVLDINSVVVGVVVNDEISLEELKRIQEEEEESELVMKKIEENLKIAELNRIKERSRVEELVKASNIKKKLEDEIIAAEKAKIDELNKLENEKKAAERKKRIELKKAKLAEESFEKKLLKAVTDQVKLEEESIVVAEKIRLEGENQRLESFHIEEESIKSLENARIEEESRLIEFRRIEEELIVAAEKARIEEEVRLKSVRIKQESISAVEIIKIEEEAKLEAVRIENEFKVAERNKQIELKKAKLLKVAEEKQLLKAAEQSKIQENARIEESRIENIREIEEKIEELSTLGDSRIENNLIVSAMKAIKSKIEEENRLVNNLSQDYTQYIEPILIEAEVPILEESTLSECIDSYEEESNAADEKSKLESIIIVEELASDAENSRIVEEIRLEAIRVEEELAEKTRIDEEIRLEETIRFEKEIKAAERNQRIELRKAKLAEEALERKLIKASEQAKIAAETRNENRHNEDIVIEAKIDHSTEEESENKLIKDDSIVVAETGRIEKEARNVQQRCAEVKLISILEQANKEEEVNLEAIRIAKELKVAERKQRIDLKKAKLAEASLERKLLKAAEQSNFLEESTLADTKIIEDILISATEQTRNADEKKIESIRIEKELKVAERKKQIELKRAKLAEEALEKKLKSAADQVKLEEQAQLDEENRLEAIRVEEEQARIDEEIRLETLCVSEELAEKNRIAEEDDFLASLLEEESFGYSAEQIKFEEEQTRIDEENRLETIRVEEELAAAKEQARIDEEIRLETIRVSEEQARIDEDIRLESIRVEEEQAIVDEEIRIETIRVSEEVAAAEEQTRIDEEIRFEAIRVSEELAEKNRIAEEDDFLDSLLEEESFGNSSEQNKFEEEQTRINEENRLETIRVEEELAAAKEQASIDEEIRLEAIRVSEELAAAKEQTRIDEEN
jgi:hypothetical protein